MVDVLYVSLASTAGLRAADAELAGALERAGASVAMVAPRAPRPVRTFALTDLAWARAARIAAARGIAEHRPRAVLYGAMGAALLWPQPGAIRLDAPMAANRPGRHGLWQRPVERRRLRETPLLVTVSALTLAEVPRPHPPAVVVPIAVGASGPPAPERDIAALTYAANPHKKGLDRVLAAWARARRPGEELWVAGVEREAAAGAARRAGRGAGDDPGAAADGVRWVGRLAPADYRALVRRARVFVAAPRREDYGIAQLEALADGCVLVTTPAPGPYEALPIARELDPRLAGEDVAGALRTALDDPAPGYAARAAAALERFSPAAVDAVVARELLPALIAR